MSLQTALQEHCQFGVNQPMAASAVVEGIETMGFVGPSLAVDATLGGILELVTSWLKQADLIPPKEDVLMWVGEAFDTYIAVNPPFAGHPIATRFARKGLLSLVSAAYDAID